MFKLNTDNKKAKTLYIIATLFSLLFLFSGGVQAFQVSGNGNNLRIVQSNRAKSSSFQLANTQLKTTAVSQAVITDNTSVVTTTVTPTLTPTVSIPNISNSRGDGSSPYLGSANFGHNGRSEIATQRRKNSQNRVESLKSSAPKNIIEENDKKSIEEKTSKPKEEITQNKLIKPNSDFVVTNNSKVKINPAKFSLKFLAGDIVEEELPEKETEYIILYSNNNYYWHNMALIFLIIICMILATVSGLLSILIISILNKKNIYINKKKSSKK